MSYTLPVMIRVADLRKSFGSLVAVDGVSFEILPGETFGLLGPNGAGKTTTINLLLGALTPDEGTVVLDGLGDPTRADVRRRLGICPQDISLYDDLTARENLVFFGKLYGLRGAQLRARVAWALDLVGLAERQRDRVKNYSGGMQRRLNLACALVHDPQLILMDEPTVGVDPQSRNHIFDNIETLKREGRTILYTTHYMEEAQRLCDRVAIMDHGKVLALDPVPDLIAAYGGQAVIEVQLEHVPDNPNNLPGRLDGKTLRIKTDDPLREIARLGKADLPFVGLRVNQPDLERVFLALTGRRLRD